MQQAPAETGRSEFGSTYSESPGLVALTSDQFVSSVHSPAYQRFLQRLREARAEAGLSQRAVAEELKRVPSFVAKCENGERRVDVIELLEFAKVYRKPISYFLPVNRGSA